MSHCDGKCLFDVRRGTALNKDSVSSAIKIANVSQAVSSIRLATDSATALWSAVPRPVPRFLREGMY